MTSVRSGLLLTLISAGTLAAQAPAAAAGERAPAPRGAATAAQLFLANTAQLQLNDQQVTRLAAIARRAESREQARRAAFDTLRARAVAPTTDSAARAQRRLELANAMRVTMERSRDERHADLRDALAVLTPDQQARAWELRGRGDRGPRMRPAGRALRRGEMGRGARRDGMRRGMRSGTGSGTRRPL